MKIFALYLPQFHEIPENNEWWGNGFTEWTNVKKAKPLYKGHMQPKHPLGNNYYNLLEKETVLWQTEVMKSYGIYGMIYYHYYFCGKKLLEKPAENLLKWQEINQPFFFCWANHSWNRAWKGSREVIMEQTYGIEDNWREHFEYLLPFFQDERYEKKDNMPVFMIYQAKFPEKERMLKCFDNWCKDYGFDGLYAIEICFSVNEPHYQYFIDNMSSVTKAHFLTEPLCGRLRSYYEKNSFMRRVKNKLLSIMRKKGILKKVEIFDGNKIYKAIIEKEPYGKQIIHGVFFEWDNTPRHGYRGFIISPPEKELFKSYMNKLNEEEYVFINAWNEWAEGMVMEPSEELAFRYLEWIKECVQ